MNNILIKNVRESLSDFGFKYYHLWQGIRNYPYEDFLNDDNKETRKHALIAFCLYLGYGWTHATIPFSENVLKNYIKAFVANHKEIQNDFPVIYSEVVYLLNQLYHEQSRYFDKEMQEYILNLPLDQFQLPNKVEKLCEVFDIPTSETF